MRPHPDLDLLALHALGEPVLDDPARDHVVACSRCAGTVAELAGTVRVARGPAAHEPAAGTPPVAVPAHVWQGISAELGLDPTVRPASVGPSSLRSRGETAAAPQHRGTGSVPVPGAPAGPVATGASDPTSAVRPVRARRGVGTLRLLAVAAAGLAVGAVGTALVVPRLGGDAAPEPTVLAAADLEAFGAGEGTDVSGSARLASVRPEEAGDRVLQVWLDELPDTGDGFFEAWLIDPDTGAMVSLGPVPTGAPGEVTVELPVPRGLDVAAYELVDVSAEPLDGDPTHSGASLVRGTLGT